ncbi:TPA: Gfo/Idh/MocA family oxidoreductase [Candidatus Poribacteria bacterium]|nr:Gfo/Idh/MocA family oxidoreductase [Candidatus Poribacteria bacterium]
MYKAAILGCRGRSKGHMRAYEYVKKGKVVAICDLVEELLNSFGDEFGIERRYTDIHEMLDKEKPDLLHIVTRPALRVELLSIAAEHEVPVVIVEKPIAIDSEDYLAICRLNEESPTKFIVNHQLHFHPKRLELQRDVDEGRIGEIRLLEVSARLNLLGQGTHILELLFSFNGHTPATSVFGQVSGDKGLYTNHPAPDMAEAVITFENGARGVILCGHNAPRVDERGESHRHKRISVYGTRGFIQWQMNFWERGTPEGYESGEKSYGAEDVLGQAALTDAAFEWLEDEDRPHPTRLELALQQFNVILGLYASALERRPVELPYKPEGNFLDRLKENLKT